MTWVVEQPIVQVVLALGLAPGVCANVKVDVVLPTGGAAGVKQPDWQAAACELQVIMQFVVVELCADAPPDAAITATPNTTAKLRMTAFCMTAPDDGRSRPHYSPVEAGQECTLAKRAQAVRM